MTWGNWWIVPILTVEPAVWPDDLFAEDRMADASEMRWWVLHTKPRAEKSLARRLLADDASFFLPLRRHRRRIQRRLVSSYVPLFPGYLFLRGDDVARQAAIETRFAVGSLHVENQQQLSEELANIHRLIQSGISLSPEERLQPGMPAEIVSGPLAGLRGCIQQRRGAKTVRFIIEVQFLQQGTSVEVDSSMIRPV